MNASQFVSYKDTLDKDVWTFNDRRQKWPRARLTFERTLNIFPAVAVFWQRAISIAIFVHLSRRLRKVCQGKYARHAQKETPATWEVKNSSCKLDKGITIPVAFPLPRKRIRCRRPFWNKFATARRDIWVLQIIDNVLEWIVMELFQFLSKGFSKFLFCGGIR